MILLPAWENDSGEYDRFLERVANPGYIRHPVELYPDIPDTPARMIGIIREIKPGTVPSRNGTKHVPPPYRYAKNGKRYSTGPHKRFGQ